MTYILLAFPPLSVDFPVRISQALEEIKITFIAQQ